MGSTMQANWKAEAISSLAELREEALTLLHPELQPPDYINLLVEKNLFADAVRFLAHALPKREAVWWGWVCARRADPDPTPVTKAALAATEAWIAQPTD